MFTKSITAGVVASALLATVAFAQTPTTTTDRGKMAPAPAAASEPAALSSASFQGDWRTSKIIGLNVYNDSNESLGSISDLLTDKTGNIKGVVIGVGGILGVGEHLVAVSFDKIKFVDEPAAYKGAANTPAKPASTTTTGAATSSPAPAVRPLLRLRARRTPNPWYPDHAVYNATKDELKAMPEFKYSM